MKRLIAFLLLALALPAMPDAFGQCIYQLDDGTSDGAIGPLLGDGYIALNAFTVGGGSTGSIVSVEACFFSTDQIVQTVAAAVWSDPNQDGNPSDAVLLGTSAPTISAFTCQTLALETPVDVGDDGTLFFVGVYYQTDPGTNLLVSHDTSGSGSSWTRNVTSGPPDPSNLPTLFPHSQHLMIRAACQGTTGLVDDATWGRIKALYRD